jgi:hypothetical protein
MSAGNEKQYFSGKIMTTEANLIGARMWKESGFAKFKALSPYLAERAETKQRTTGLGRPVYGDHGC